MIPVCSDFAFLHAADLLGSPTVSLFDLAAAPTTAPHAGRACPLCFPPTPFGPRCTLKNIHNRGSKRAIAATFAAFAAVIVPPPVAPHLPSVAQLG